MTNATARTRADVLADMRDMRASLGTDEPYVSPMRFDELHTEWMQLAEADSVDAWQKYEDRVIGWDQWRKRHIEIEEDRVAVDAHAAWFRAVAADMQAGLM